MKITIESTTRVIEINGGLEARVWEGQTERGVKVQCLIPRIAVKDGLDVSQFEAELKECHVPASRDVVQAFPLRMVL
jgi:hypothetical protein